MIIIFTKTNNSLIQIAIKTKNDEVQNESLSNYEISIAWPDPGKSNSA